ARVHALLGPFAERSRGDAVSALDLRWRARRQVSHRRRRLRRHVGRRRPRPHQGEAQGRKARALRGDGRKAGRRRGIEARTHRGDGKSRRLMKTALVTGTTSGIGRVLVKELLDRGWEVIAHARSKEKLDKE